MGIQKIKTISQYHQALGIPKPKHPLISVINLEQLEPVASFTKGRNNDCQYPAIY